MNDILPQLSISYVKHDSIYLKNVSLSRKSTSNTKSISSSSHHIFQNQFAFSLLKEINLLRINPKCYSIKLRQCLEHIKLNTLNNKYYFYYDRDDNNRKLKLKITKDNFNECITYLNTFDNELLQPLEYSSELTIPFPSDDTSLAYDKHYLCEQIEQLKQRIKNKFVFIDFQYDISTDPVTSAIIQVVDSKKVNYQRRNNFLNENARYVGISYGKVSDELFCFYLVFAKFKQ